MKESQAFESPQGPTMHSTLLLSSDVQIAAQANMELIVELDVQLPLGEWNYMSPKSNLWRLLGLRCWCEGCTRSVIRTAHFPGAEGFIAVVEPHALLLKSFSRVRGTALERPSPRKVIGGLVC